MNGGWYEIELALMYDYMHGCYIYELVQITSYVSSQSLYTFKPDILSKLEK